ncbi:zinc finger protein 518A [Ambystoma mexicanum]|uniref:zinc finger protein 518A n=1 Tax=Ambystoma mexicanum TaxID=8296 RepID=UPI0037E7FA6D
MNLIDKVTLKEGDGNVQLYPHKRQTARKSLSKARFGGVCTNGSESIYLQAKTESVSEEDGIRTSSKICNFPCPKCKGKIRYSPNDLQKHYWLLHHGELPNYPCEMCSFSSNDFQKFTEHRHTHRNTLVKCEICNDYQLFSLLDLTKHFTSNHSINGNFRCEKCIFSTRDVGTFVQHIHRHCNQQFKCVKCNYAFLNNEEFQEHLIGHTRGFPFGCQFCSFRSTRRDYIVNHVIAVHRGKLHAKDTLGQDDSENKCVETQSALKLALKRFEIEAPRIASWKRKTNQVANDETARSKAQEVECKTEHQSHSSKEHFVNDANNTVAGRCYEIHNSHIGASGNEKQNSKQDAGPTTTTPYSKLSNGSKTATEYINQVDASSPTTDNDKQENISNTGFLRNAVHGPTVLMVKNNKISVPANYCAKFMGFKIVEGKQHIVIKLLPTNKHNVCAPEYQSVALKDSSINPLQIPTNRIVKCEPASSATGHAPYQETQQSAESCPTSTPFSDTNFSVKANGAKQSMPSHARNLSGTPIPETMFDVKSMSKMPERSTSMPNSSDKVPISEGNAPILGQSSVPSNSGPPGKLFTSDCLTTPKEKAEGPCDQLLSQESLLLSGPASSTLNITDDRKWDHSYPSQSHLNMANGQGNHTELFVPSDCNLLNSESLPENVSSNSGNQCFQPLIDLPPPENQADACGRLSSKPKAYLYSIQNPPALSFVPVKVGQVVQNAVKGKSNTYQTFSNSVSSQLTASQQYPSNLFTSVNNSLASSSLHCTGKAGTLYTGGDVALTCKSTNLESERKILPTSHPSQEGRVIKTSNIGKLLKTHSNAIINTQLAKEKLGVTSHNPSSFPSVKLLRPRTLTEGSRFLIRSSPNGLLVPLHFSNKPGLQIVSRGPICSNNLTSISNEKPPSALLNKGRGMVLAFGGAALGAVTNIPVGSVQVLGTVPQNNQDEQKMPNANNSSSSNLNQNSQSIFDQVSQVPLQGPFILANSIIPPIQLAMATPQINEGPIGLNALQYLGTQEHPGATSGTLKSAKLNQEAEPKQHINAVLPDGRRAVLVKCVAPSGLTQSTLQVNASNQNAQPNHSEGTKMKYFLKVVKTPPFQVPAACKNQSIMNTSLASLKSDDIQSSGNISQVLTPVVYSSSALPGTIIPNVFLSSSTYVPPEESLPPTNHLRTLLQKCSTKPAQEVDASKRSDSLQQEGACNHIQNNISKNNCDLIQTGPKTGRKKQNLRCKSKAEFEEPPRKKKRPCKANNQTGNETDCVYTFEPRESKETMKTLRLLPFSRDQTVKCPLKNQPVVVLNHPDADFPEVLNVMKTITKFKGQVVKVSLSRRTMEALLNPTYGNTSEMATSARTAKRRRTFLPVSPVKERFVLKLTLKKTSKNNYTIVKSSSKNIVKTKFTCWFCGRIFENQDDWVGHGQRHLMEATRDWNTLIQGYSSVTVG